MKHSITVYPRNGQDIFLNCLRGSWDIVITNNSDCLLFLHVDDNVKNIVQFDFNQTLTFGGCPLHANWVLSNIHDEPAEVLITYSNNSFAENLTPRHPRKPRKKKNPKDDSDDDLAFIYSTRKQRKCKT